MPEDILVLRPDGCIPDRFYQVAGIAVKPARGVVDHLVLLGLAQAFPLGGHQVQQLGPGLFPQLAQHPEQAGQVVPVYRPGIPEIQAFKKVLFAWLARFYLGQVFLEGPDTGVDADGVVVEDDKQVGPGNPCVVQGFKGHSAGDGGIADHGDVPALRVPLQAGCERHAEQGRDRGRGMAGAKGVVGAFVPAWEAADAPLLADGGKGFASPGEDLVAVGLVAHVPDQAVFGGLVHVVEGKGQLHDPQAGAQVAFLGRYHVDDAVAQFTGQFREAALGQSSQGCRIVYVLQQVHRRRKCTAN